MTRDDLFSTNASVVRDLATAAARVAPKANLCIITNPVNSMVPIATRVYERAGVYDPKRIFGVSTLDVVRATRFLAGLTSQDPANTPVTVVGGHSGETIVPLFSQQAAAKGITGEAYKKLVHRVQFGGDEVVQAKAGAGSATLSMAYAGARFANALFRGLAGEKGVITPSYVRSPLFESEGIDFFASNIELGVRVYPPVELSMIANTLNCSPTVLRRSTLSASSLLRSRSTSRPRRRVSRRTSRRALPSSSRCAQNHVVDARFRRKTFAFFGCYPCDGLASPEISLFFILHEVLLPPTGLH